MRLILLLFLFIASVNAQTSDLNTLSFEEYLGYVTKFHPMVKSANLQISSAQANLMVARGGFDPKIEVDFDKKNFNEKTYYSVLNSSFKIPTWYGIEVKAGFDTSDGLYLNPQNTAPDQGLASLGLSVALGQGMFINKRMADLRNAKLQVQLSRSERQLMVVQVLYDASLAYFNWMQHFREVQLYQNYLNNATVRYHGIRTLIVHGDKPAVDSVEASINVRNRKLSLEEAQLKLKKSVLELSTFMWFENNVPLELQETIIPEENVTAFMQEMFHSEELLNEVHEIANHPKINALQRKLDILTIDRKLKANLLLPKIEVGYQYLSGRNDWNTTNFNNYKIGVNATFPILLRKERGSLKLAAFKIQDAEWDLRLQQLQLTNKISAQQAEIKSLEKQRLLISDLAKDYATMLSSEERLFMLGESSLFLINSRENNLIASKLATIAAENRYLKSKAELFKIVSRLE